MSNVVSFGPKNSIGDRSAKPPRASDPAAVLRQADRIKAEMVRRPMVHSPKERLKLAENIWTLMEAATRQKPSITKFDILHAAGQAPHKEDSTKRLFKFAIDPILPIDERDARAKKHLARHVNRYAKIATKAAELSGMDANEALVLLTRGTAYERPTNEGGASPYDDALADIQTALERSLETTNSVGNVTNYFGLLRRHRLTLGSVVEESGREPGPLRFVSAINVWRATYLKHQARHFVSDGVVRCIPKAMIGRGFLRTVPGKLVLKLGEGVRPFFNGEPAIEKSHNAIELPAHIDFGIDVALALCTFDEPPRAAPTLLIRPAIRIRLQARAPYVNLQRGEADDPSEDDWALLNWERGDFDVVAHSAEWSEWKFENACDLTGSDADEAIDKRLVMEARYTIDELSGDDELRELEQPQDAKWLVEPLTLAAQRKWLLREMRDEDGFPLDISIPAWVAEGPNPADALEFLASASGLRDELKAEHWASIESYIRGVREGIAKWHRAHLYEPTSCPEGTLAAALERGIFEGSRHACGPAHCIAAEFGVLNVLMTRDVKGVAKKRKDFIGKL